MPFLDELERRQIDPKPALLAENLTRESANNQDIFVPAQVIYDTIEALAQTAKDPYLGITIGAQLDISNWSPFMQASAQAKNTAELLLMCAVNASKDATSSSLNLETAGERTRFHVRRLLETKTDPTQVDSFWIGILVALLERAAGTGWQPDEVIATVCEPTTIPANYHGIRIARGGLDGPSISFPSKWLFLPLTPKAAKGISAVAGTPAKSLHDSVRQTLAPHIDEPDLNVDRAAEFCSLGRRALQRQLQNSGTTVKQVIIELRRERAIAELTGSETPIAEIAGMVGFVDATVFSRAFKNWTGLSPLQYRKQHR
jgi:AraC-like DNA-binding protein